jgi:polyether ionophore transport system ATP-binding protein
VSNSQNRGRTDQVAIRTEGLCKRYGDHEALVDLDLEVARGEVVGYLGPNGAGKTTTIRLLLGLARPTSGRAQIFGLDVRRRAVEVHRRVAFVPGDTALWPALTGEETLHLLARLHGSCDTAYRDHLVGAFDLDTAKKVRAYSKGNRQKVSLVAAFMARADLLVLDEPTSGLDPLMEQVFRACVLEAKGRGQTVLLSSHVLAEVEAVCDRVAILRSGRLVETGTLAELRHLRAVSVDATLTGPAPGIASLPGLSDLRVEGRRLRCQVAGPVEPLLQALTAAGVEQLLIREPSLEELFLAHYGDAGPERPAVAS